MIDLRTKKPKQLLGKAVCSKRFSAVSGTEVLTTNPDFVCSKRFSAYSGTLSAYYEPKNPFSSEGVQNLG